MKDTLNYLSSHKTLGREESKAILIEMAKGQFSESEMAAFLAVYLMRPITVEEMVGFREALLELCLAIDLSAYDPIDLCGTGGDGKDTFNISTLASFVVAGAGIKVAKHGNYGVSSVSGSSNMMEYFGIRFTNDEQVLQRQLETSGICFLHAPFFHPALKNVGPVRQALRVKTFFNMLGPMVNPAGVKHQLVGVFNLELARIYAYLYQQTAVNYTIVHALDGYDEVSLTGQAKVYGRHRERLITPEEFGVETLSAEQIRGGASVPEMAKIFIDVLKGLGTAAQQNVVCANAALAINCVYPELSLEQSFQLAAESLQSGKALSVFNKLVELQ
ncbi:MAG TPA: anthranilate phosphoribosyltransferase [Luteibaculaceae bacterium]|nr:anthranilate phosphoribosyltransferase [Luteibaculaceae bacterium]